MSNQQQCPFCKGTIITGYVWVISEGSLVWSKNKPKRSIWSSDTWDTELINSSAKSGFKKAQRCVDCKRLIIEDVIDLEIIPSWLAD